MTIWHRPNKQWHAYGINGMSFCSKWALIGHGKPRGSRSTTPAKGRCGTCLRLVRSFEALGRSVRNYRRKVLSRPIPRNQCPGCFSSIYDGAAEDGWCTHCYPKRAEYEKGASTSTATKAQ